MSCRVLVADKIAEAGLEYLRAADDVEFDVRHGLPPQELASVVGQYDGMLIRSAVRVTAQTLASPGKLSAIARAGVGVDNIDLEAATSAGVLVLNTPDANTISTAEHTIAMMLALHRHIPAADSHVRDGQWKRGDFQGQQVAGKTLGIVGLGRIGRAVAHRALAFDMKVVAFDPFVTAEGAEQAGVELVKELPDLLSMSDCITLHASLPESRKPILNEAEFAAMKPGARVVNCARGALIDEAALAAALNSGHLGGAAIDVFANEPPEGSPLLTAKNVVLTPHLAASTAQAQQQVAVEAVESLLAYLQHGEIRSAVNVAGIPRELSPRQRAFMDLCSRIGTILSVWCSEGLERIRVTSCVTDLSGVAPILARQALVSVLSPHLDTRLNLVNAEGHAQHRGIAVEHTIQTPGKEAPQTVTVTVDTGGDTHEIVGSVFADSKGRILAIDGYRMEIVPERCLVLIFNDDKPGVIGLVGRHFGDAGINIADMALSRRGKTALMVLKLDTPMPDDLRETLLGAKPPIFSVHSVTLPGDAGNAD